MKSIKLDAPAKINLFLEIVGKLPSGYHALNSVMQSITLCDSLTLTQCDTSSNELQPDITITCSDPSIPADRENLALRAAHAFFEQTGFLCRQSLRIHIEKRIPVAAGLAGGSADAAAVLRGLNLLFSSSFTEERLCQIGKTLGADIPFCIHRKTAITQGIGEIFSLCMPLPDCFIVVAIRRGMHTSAGEAYALYDASPNAAIRNGTMPQALQSGDLSKIGAALYNVFSRFYPSTDDPCNLMIRHGAAGALMSGSGPAVFGLFASCDAAQQAQQQLLSQNYDAFLCKPWRPMKEHDH